MPFENNQSAALERFPKDLTLRIESQEVENKELKNESEATSALTLKEEKSNKKDGKNGNGKIP